MVKEFTIRQYKPSDADRVWTIHERALRASPLEFVEDAPADADLTNISECYLDVGGEFLVGLIDEQIIAIGGFQPQENKTAELRRMRVHPDHQQHGYGAQLLGTLEERARKQGFTRIVLETNAYLRAAQKLYENYGYKESHRERHPMTADEFIHYQKEI
ncbi:GNAT family N-acetyltransferase [Haladaptatus salinisoli]|uniref:GNAT family N-acetyltransferase n=1 Tax=Haladaptatus salinisoli TaxID=2884876 RepID=UPI001D0B053C|nr:GNAT family N-acetyltransferase [Haladaptatus salinisoli]